MAPDRKKNLDPADLEKYARKSVEKRDFDVTVAKVYEIKADLEQRGETAKARAWDQVINKLRDEPDKN